MNSAGLSFSGRGSTLIVSGFDSTCTFCVVPNTSKMSCGAWVMATLNAIGLIVVAPGESGNSVTFFSSATP